MSKRVLFLKRMIKEIEIEIIEIEKGLEEVQQQKKEEEEKQRIRREEREKEVLQQRLDFCMKARKDEFLGRLILGIPERLIELWIGAGQMPPDCEPVPEEVKNIDCRSSKMKWMNDEDKALARKKWEVILRTYGKNIVFFSNGGGRPIVSQEKEEMRDENGSIRCIDPSYFTEETEKSKIITHRGKRFKMFYKDGKFLRTTPVDDDETEDEEGPGLREIPVMAIHHAFLYLEKEYKEGRWIQDVFSKCEGFREPM